MQMKELFVDVWLIEIIVFRQKKSECERHLLSHRKIH